MAFENYRAAVRYLVEDVWHGSSSRPRSNASPQERIRALLGALGDPQSGFPVIHVGGTTGKGSTAAMTAAVLEEAGLRVGLCVSPFLQTYIERISINGQLIGPDQFANALSEIKQAGDQMADLWAKGPGRPTILEILFAIAMDHFKTESIDVAVVEVGLGGRTDCTNVFEPSAVAAITNVQLDHVRQLGGTPALIAAEKAAIIKPGARAVTGATGEALRVVEDHCSRVGVSLWRTGHEVSIRPLTCGAEVTTPSRNVVVAPAMVGRHQLDNAGLAIAAVDAFSVANGLSVGDTAVVTAIGRARQPGRFELMQRSPTVILDGAHNPAAADVLAATITEETAMSGGRLLLLIGILEDKDRDGILRRLVPLADHVVITRPPLEERAGNTADVQALARKHLRDSAETELIEDPDRALDRMLAIAGGDDVILVTGSIYLIGQLRGRWFPEEQLLAERRLSFAAL